MASVFKRNRLEPIPPAATFFDRAGKRFARWDDGGKVREARVSKNGDKIVLPPGKDEPYRIAWDDPGTGQRRMRVAYVDREASMQLARKLEREAARRAEGLVDPFDQHLLSPIQGVIDEWFGAMTARRAPQMKMQVERIVGGTECQRLHQLDAPKVNAMLCRLKASEEWSDTTFNEYVASARAFTKWAVVNRRLPHDPLIGLARIKGKLVKPSRPRRAMSQEEVGRLLKSAEARPLRELLMIRRGERKGQFVANVGKRASEKAARLGRERRLCYLLAFWARLRRSEIRQLRWSDIELDVVPPRIVLRAETTKAKRADTVPIHQQLAAELLACRPAGADLSRVVKTVPSMQAFRLDLAAAGIRDVDSLGLHVDLHALGKSFVTAMAAHGVSQRAAQSLARHTDPRLTATTYTDTSLLPLADELAKVPPIPDVDVMARQPIVLSATGTDPTGTEHPAAHLQRTRDTDMHSSADVCATGSMRTVPGMTMPVGTKPSGLSGKSTKRNGPALSCTGPEKEAGDRGRTDDIHVGNVTLYH